MLKRLTEEKLEEILEAGITEFGEQGFEKTSMSRLRDGPESASAYSINITETKMDFFWPA